MQVVVPSFPAPKYHIWRRGIEPFTGLIPQEVIDFIMAVALSGLPCMGHFDTVGEPATLAQRWKRWEREFKLYVAAAGVTDDTQKRALLLHLAGQGVRDIFATFSEEDRGNDSDFNTAVQLLAEHFKQKKNVPMARQAFISATPKPGETINNFASRLKTLVEDCDYGDEKDFQVRDRVIFHIVDKPLKSKLYRENNLTLAKLLEVVGTYHDKEALVLLPAAQANYTSHGASKTGKSSQSRDRGPRDSGKAKGKCFRCDKVGHFARDCKSSRNHMCEKCGRAGHFAVCCHTKQKDDQQPSGGEQQHRQGGGRQKNQYRGHGYANAVSSELPLQGGGDVEPATSDYYVFRCRTVTLRYAKNKVAYHTAGGGDASMTFLVENNPIVMHVDSGASCNLMSETVFNSINRDGNSDIQLRRCDKRVYTYASTRPLPLMGKCQLKVTVPETGMCKAAEFIIVKGDHPTLLGKQTSQEIEILKIGIGVNQCSTSDRDGALSELRQKYPRVFSGLGTLKDYQLRLHIDHDVRPVAQPIRRIPFSRRVKVINKLKELEKLGVIEKVKGPTSWVSPLVTVEKPNGDVRICIDMRQANQAVIREKHPIPTVEETLQEISDAKVFAKLDLNMAFHQIELHPDSRDITTFASPNGLYRYRRLIFGVNMATEMFQHLIWQIVSGCPGVCNIHDDIRVVAENHDQLRERVEKVIQKLGENGLTLNYDKCEMGVKTMTFMGETLTSQGLKVSDSKVRAILGAPRPTNKSELRSFLGLAQFCSKFIPRFATVTSPLWDLTKADAEWNWTSTEDDALSELKTLLTNSPVMAYHKQGAETRIVTDASPVGLGAILEQKQQDGEYRPIYYASRRLSPVEQRYSQFEREALGVKWACQKFYLYLSGIEFEICTDHKPLIHVLGPKSKPPSARIERWLLYLQQFKYKVRHIAGKFNYADVLSRLPTGSQEMQDACQTEDYIYSIVMDAVPAALTARQIEQESAKDPTLQKVTECLKSGEWSKLQGTMYRALKDELWQVGQVVMRGDRIVVPRSLWEKTLQLAHEGHQGIVRTKSRLRQRVWWPDMDKQVEMLVKSCYPCQLVAPRPKPEPVRSTVLPRGPWSDLATDLLDIPNDNHLLVVIDYYSRWPEVIQVTKTDAGHIIKSMEAIFRTHGIPESMRSDNGPPFQSREFEGFLGYLGIDHRKGIPLWPQSNGEVERFNATILKIVRIANLEGKNWRGALQDFLFQYRTTPHTVTGKSPAELLMGRKLRDKLPRVLISNDKINEADWQSLLRERDARQKLRQKEFADQKRGAEISDVLEGDQVLLEQKRQNKLTTNYESAPYEVLQRDGNAATLRGPDGVVKLRNVACMKKACDST